MRTFLAIVAGGAVWLGAMIAFFAFAPNLELDEWWWNYALIGVVAIVTYLTARAVSLDIKNEPLA